MREIEFRTFCKSLNKMLSFEHWKEATKGMVDVANEEMQKRGLKYNKLAPYGLFLPLEDDDLIFMQYTGLCDKNGTKIFEGDIVEVYAQRHICNQQRSQYDVPVKVRAFVEHCSNWNGVGFHFNYKNKHNDKLCQPIGREEDERSFYYRPIQDFDFNRNKKETHSKFLWKNHIEVIGNIYDNPELLEGDGNDQI